MLSLMSMSVKNPVDTLKDMVKLSCLPDEPVTLLYSRADMPTSFRNFLL